jgi:hypothetical protein
VAGTVARWNWHRGLDEPRSIDASL